VSSLHRLLAAAAALTTLTLGCTAGGSPLPTSSAAAGSQAAAQVIRVSSTPTACALSSTSAASGTTTFEVRNEGSVVTEFYVLAQDGLRIVAERENIAPGSTAELIVPLQPGSYRTACKPGMRGAAIGESALTVTGERIQLSGDDQQLFDAVVKDYVAFVKNEVAELQPKADAFVEAYVAGRDEEARRLFPAARVHYERIEPIAEALGLLDPRLDYREIDYLAEADALAQDDPTFTQWLGFHRMEKDLWVPAKDAVQADGTNAWDGWTPSTAQQRSQIGRTLVGDIAALYDRVHADDFITAQGLDIASVSNGAAALLEEIAVGKVTGEEDWWSHTDLWDFQGNLEGARIAFDLVAPIASRRGGESATLVALIDERFDDLQAALNQYGSLEKGFVSYDTVTREQQRALVERIDAAREPLSKLTNAVLSPAAS
jgi:iron uptake system component EfeO